MNCGSNKSSVNNIFYLNFFLLDIFIMSYLHFLLIFFILVLSLQLNHSCKYEMWLNFCTDWVQRRLFFLRNLYLCIFIVLAFLILRIFLSIFYWEFLSILKGCWIYSSPDDTTGYKMLSFRKTSCSLFVFWLIKYYLLKQLCIYLLQTKTKIYFFGVEPLRKNQIF